MVTILLFGHALCDAVGESEIQCDLPAPTTVKALIESSPPPFDLLVPFMKRGELLVTVNRKIGTLDTLVRDGDTIKLTHQVHPTYEGARWQNP
jgi:molybdopterin synthase sulfur carrier subunit